MLQAALLETVLPAVASQSAAALEVHGPLLAAASVAAAGAVAEVRHPKAASTAGSGNHCIALKLGAVVQTDAQVLDACATICRTLCASHGVDMGASRFRPVPCRDARAPLSPGSGFRSSAG